MIKGWVHKVISIPYTSKAGKELIEQKIDMLVKSIKGAKAEDTRQIVGGGFRL